MMTNNTYNMSITGEVSPQNKEDIMSEETMHSPNNTESAEVSGKRTRNAYDGSKAHGITADLEHVKTITAYDNAVERLAKRRGFLISEYKVIAEKYQATDDVSDRAKLLKEKGSKESQIKAITKTSKSLSSIKNEIEEAEREAQAAVEFIDFDAA